MWHNSLIPTIIFYGKVLICNKRTPGFQFYFTAFFFFLILLVLQLCYLISGFFTRKSQHTALTGNAVDFFYKTDVLMITVKKNIHVPVFLHSL